jgi:glyceraldehyde 3-phosphate dehydrogenase
MGRPVAVYYSVVSRVGLVAHRSLRIHRANRSTTRDRSCRHQRLRPHRPQLLPCAVQASGADIEIVAVNDLTDNKYARPPAQVRLRSRPSSRGRQLDRRVHHRRRQGPSRSSPSATPPTRVGRRRRRRRRSSRPASSPTPTRRRPTSTAAPRRSSSPRPPATRTHLRDGRQRRRLRPGQQNVISNASCTTNCLGPMAKVLSTTTSASSRA